MSDPDQRASAAESQAGADTPPAAESQVGADTPPAGATPADPGAPAPARRRPVEEAAAIALDSADVASRSAAAALNAGTELRAAAAQFQGAADRVQKRSIVLLAAAAGVMLVALIFFAVVGVRMIGRINQLDGMLVAVGKRVVELQSGLDTLGTVHRSLDDVARKHSAATESNAQLQARLDTVLKQTEQLAQQLPAVAARQVSTQNDAVHRQMQAIHGRLQAQASVLQTLGNDIGALKAALANVDRLNRDLRALLATPRERAVEAAPRAAPVAPATERLVQYPRPAPPQRTGTPEANPSGTSPAPAGPRVP